VDRVLRFLLKGGFTPDACGAAKGYTSIWVTLERLDVILREYA